MPRLREVRGHRRTEVRKSSSNLKGSPVAIDGSPLGWRFCNVDLSGPFSVSSLSEQDRRTVWERMTKFEQMTMAQIRDTKSHSISIYQLGKDARKRLQELNLDDLDDLWSFRVTGKKRFWCIKQQNVYALLWWDPQHRVCPSPKKHT